MGHFLGTYCQLEPIPWNWKPEQLSKRTAHFPQPRPPPRGAAFYIITQSSQARPRTIRTLATCHILLFYPALPYPMLSDPSPPTLPKAGLRYILWLKGFLHICPLSTLSCPVAPNLGSLVPAFPSPTPVEGWPHACFGFYLGVFSCLLPCLLASEPRGKACPMPHPIHPHTPPPHPHPRSGAVPQVLLCGREAPAASDVAQGLMIGVEAGGHTY